MLSHIGPIVIIVVLLIVGGLIRTFFRNASRAVVAVLADPDDPDIGVQAQWLRDARSEASVLPNRDVPVTSAPRHGRDDAVVVTPDFTRGDVRDDAASARKKRVARRTAAIGGPQVPPARRSPLEPQPPLRTRATHPPLPALVARTAMTPISPHPTTASRSDSWR